LKFNIVLISLDVVPCKIFKDSQINVKFFL